MEASSSHKQATPCEMARCIKNNASTLAQPPALTWIDGYNNTGVVHLCEVQVAHNPSTRFTQLHSITFPRTQERK